MKRSAIISLATIVVLGTLVAGCAAPAATSGVYRARQTGTEQMVRMAVVESVREVIINRGETGVGTTAGAIVGGVAGSTVQLTVEATGTAPLAHQWKLHGTNLPGATATNYSKASVSTKDAGP